MAVNHTEIFDKLEKYTKLADHQNFIFDFLSLYGLPKATITRLKKTVNGDLDNINVAQYPNQGEVANQKGIYFKPVLGNEDLLTVMDELRQSAIIKTRNITFIIVTDYKEILAYDVENDESIDCPFIELHKEYGFFLPLAGLKKDADYSDQEADVKAAERLGRLFDLIRYRNNINTDEEVHALNVFLTRLLFCFFAEDTNIFKKNQFSDTLAKTTQVDGSDLKGFLQSLFKILNSNNNSELRDNSPKYLTDFPYVNGRLFAQEETVPSFDARTRRMLLECSALNWSEINPDIFGSMFQAVINENQRRRLGQHYTSVPNIMKVLSPLFLNPLEEEFIRSRHSEKKLKELLIRLGNIRVFDPACGSGNFLIIAFKELRQLEIRVFQALSSLNATPEMMMSNIRLNQFYGIEIDDFAHEIALLSLWLAEHQMNCEFNRLLHTHIATLPLHESGNILQANSLRIDWEEFCPANKEQEVYIVGNPPFEGARLSKKESNAKLKNDSALKKEDIGLIFSGISRAGNLDYVSAWFYKGAQYIANNNAEMALVATNSITQGEQATILWDPIFSLNVFITFCYQSFLWKNNARDKASVYVVIIGLSKNERKNKILYKLIGEEWHSKYVSNINSYLLEGDNILIKSRSKPLCKGVSPITLGNIAIDDRGAFSLNIEEKDLLTTEYPITRSWIKPYFGGEEYINGRERYCLWLLGIALEELYLIPFIRERINRVEQSRLMSTRPETRKLASTPSVFGEIRQPDAGQYIFIPKTTTHNRHYIPIGILSSSIIASDASLIVCNGTPYEFGVLISMIHNDWMRMVGGRHKQDYRYSGTVVYNTFPWPQNVGSQRRSAIEELAKEILKVRARHPAKTLADLYDPDKMPADLLEAHENLDRAVEKLYRDSPFRDSTERVEYLFKLYEKLINEEKQAKTAKKKKKS